MMNRFRIVLLLGIISLTPVFAGGTKDSGSGGATETAAAYTVTVAGSTSVNPLMELLTAEYASVRSNVKFNISATGSGDGIKAVPSETAEIGMSSRELTPTEIGTGIDVHLIAIDGIAVIINKGNPVSGLTIDQIRDIYTGAVTTWNQVGGGNGQIAVVSREPGSGTRGAFEEIVKFQDKLVRGAIEFDGTGAVKAEVSRNVDAIGYISLGSVDESVKALSVNGVAAATANVVNQSYKIARPFLLLTKKGKTLHPETQAFLDWILTPAGQNIVKTSWISVR
ncbi:MAG: phosphate ABC transporter substrate-binding protein [Spirochaetaceae bacterium]|jgi:phosphate transport system substrate-binding protein|nr:phosphate ABC transporter substrate-binding protein [Spirochaetaceae bacterium]